MEEFRYEAAVVWRTDVAAFIHELANRRDIACVILDHDIPHMDELPESTIVTADHLSNDINGQNGSDAARLMATSKAMIRHLPVLVWSVNPSGSERMARTLVDGRFATVARIPHLQTRYDEIAKFVREAVTA
jgi:hypothetical protein